MTVLWEEWPHVKTGINHKIKRADVLSLKDWGFSIYFPFSVYFSLSPATPGLWRKIFLSFIGLLEVPPAMVSGRASNTTRLGTGGGRLLNDGDESNVKACNSHARTHTQTLRWKSYTCSQLWYQGYTVQSEGVQGTRDRMAVSDPKANSLNKEQCRL
jgi:allophanate hydrolase subunit 2